MEQVSSAPRAIFAPTGTIIALGLAAAIGFAAGQHWSPPVGTAQPQAEASVEDWHGNVRRSYWAP